MSGPSPDSIWRQSVDEGSRRLRRGTLGLAATGLLGGVDVMLGLMLLVVLTGALGAAMPEPTAHVIGALGFGVAFVFIAVGRSELFTENFLVPLAAVGAGRGTVRSVGRLWALTLAANVVGMLIFALILGVAGVLSRDALDAAGSAADTLAQRDLLPALLSAVVAGTVMTLFTWMTAATETDVARIALGLLVGWLLIAPTLDHAIVGTGELLLGVIGGTARHASWGDVALNLPVSIAGNLAGGLAFVTLARLLQAQGERGDAERRPLEEER